MLKGKTAKRMFVRVFLAIFIFSSVFFLTVIPVSADTNRSIGVQIEAESFDSKSGMGIQACAEGGDQLGYINNDNYAVYNNVDFSTGVADFQARASVAPDAAGYIEVRLDSLTGTLLGTCTVANTGSWTTYSTFSTIIDSTTGVHNLYLVFKTTGTASYVCNLNWFKFTPASNFFMTAYEEDGTPYTTASNGDLWPCAWSDDDYLYAANGDGRGFTLTLNFWDIDVSRVSGSPAAKNMTGTTLAQGDQIAKVWGDTATYNRKPTGIVSVDGALYMAVQDLNKNFADAPNATIVKSTDKGVTWTYNTSTPMFSNHIFTTIMFLDYGKDSQYAADNYVYAYGLDYNWRWGNGTYPDPTKLYLARVPKTSIQDRSAWEFYTGDPDGNNPSWSSDINAKKPVLQDERRTYPAIVPGVSCGTDMTVICQGSIVYDQPLNRYIYSSWTEFTHEYYESPTPYGPWKLFLSKDFAPDKYSWTEDRVGGYTTVIPSKFISSDGKTLYVQSNVLGGNVSNYNMAFRKLVVEPYASTTPSNTKSADNLAMPQYGEGVTRINKSFRYADTGMMNDGNLLTSQDSYDKEAKPSDWWGYTWKRAYNLNRVVYTTGQMFSDGGWFNNIKVQVRQNNQWVDATGLNLNGYPCNNTAGNFKTYNFTFNDTWGDGVRIIGAPGGTSTYTSIAELGVCYINNDNLIQDSGFENQTTDTVSSPWYASGPDPMGIDRNLGLAHTGLNNGWINTSTTNWNCFKQSIAVTPNTDYTMTVWVQDSNITNGYIGVADANNVTFSNQKFGTFSSYTKLTLKFNSGSNTTVAPYIGYWAPGSGSWLRIDDVSVITEMNIGNLVQDPGFEKQTTNTVSSPWYTSGPDPMGVDCGIGNANTGANNGWIHTATTNWNCFKQNITVTPGNNYRMTVWVRGTSNIINGYIGIAGSGGATIANKKFGSLPGYTVLTLDFNSGSNTTLTPYIGYWSPGADSWIRIDDLTVVGINWN